MKQIAIGFMAFMFSGAGLLALSSCKAQPLTSTSAYTKVSADRFVYSEYRFNTLSNFKGTIIFEAGGGDSTKDWKQAKDLQEPFLNCIQSFSSTFTYDRPGLGNSTPDYELTVNDPISVEKVNNDLLTVLNQRHIPCPYIIISHSQGGLYAQYFIRKYPEKFAGAVFIDTLGTENFDVPDNQKDEVYNYVKVAKTHTAKYMYDVYSVELTRKYHVPEKHVVADAAYVVPGVSKDIQQILDYPKMPDLPMVVLYSTYGVQNMANWIKGQEAIAAQSEISQLKEVVGGHYIYQEQPDLVCSYVKQVVTQANSRQSR